MHDLVGRSLAPFRSEGSDRFQINGPALRVPPKIAVGLSLALHELSTNAAKYGALSSAEGHVELTWSIDSAGFCMRWEEVGGPTVLPPTRTGFGSKLIQRVLASEIEGHVELKYPPSGVVFEAIAPLVERQDEPSL